VITLKTDDEFAAMRRAGRIVAEVLAWARENVAPGVTTAEIDAAAEELIRSRGATPEFKGYQGFPASICASVNDEVVHGIPSDRRLEAGDILGIDCGARIDGFVGDAAVTLPIGAVSTATQRLLDTARECLDGAIEVAGPGVPLAEIGRAVQTLAESRGFSVVREYTGHGIGRAMHEEPVVLNYVERSPLRRRHVLRPGMAICIEPMVNAGKASVKRLKDGWTVVTRDGTLSAHFEHTVAVRESGTEVLTTL
jgi:methionyl aminopeptidase